MIKGNINNNYFIVETEIKSVIDIIKSGQFDNVDAGKYELGQHIELLIQEYLTEDASQIRLEKHEHSIEVIYIADGKEEFHWCKAEHLGDSVTEYESGKDRQFFSDSRELQVEELNKGDFVVVYPSDGHKTRCNPKEGKMKVRKYLVKLWN